MPAATTATTMLPEHGSYRWISKYQPGVCGSNTGCGHTSPHGEPVPGSGPDDTSKPAQVAGGTKDLSCMASLAARAPAHSCSGVISTPLPGQPSPMNVGLGFHEAAASWKGPCLRGPAPPGAEPGCLWALLREDTEGPAQAVLGHGQGSSQPVVAP